MHHPPSLIVKAEKSGRVLILAASGWGAVVVADSGATVDELDEDVSATCALVVLEADELAATA